MFVPPHDVKPLSDLDYEMKKASPDCAPEPMAAEVYAGCPLREGGWVSRAFLLDPDAFGPALAPVLDAIEVF